MKPHGVVAEFTGGDGGTMQLFSEPANGSKPADIAQALLDTTYPDAVKDYEIPNAMVGYELGYGEAPTSTRRMRRAPTCGCGC